MAWPTSPRTTKTSSACRRRCPSPRFGTRSQGSDAVLIATPEYNGSIPGGLKNALDWVSRPFATNVLRNKPVAVVGASTGLFGAVRAQAELRKVLTTIGADVLEAGLSVFNAREAFDAVGRLRDIELRRALCAIVHELARDSAERAA